MKVKSIETQKVFIPMCYKILGTLGLSFISISFFLLALAPTLTSATPRKSNQKKTSEKLIKIDENALAKEVAEVIQSVPEFKFIADEAYSRDLQVSFFGGTATSIVFYALRVLRGEVPRRVGEIEMREVILPSQDIDIAIDSSIEDVKDFINSIREKFPYTHTKHRDLWEGLTLRTENNRGLIDNDNFRSQHNDALSLGLVNTNPSRLHKTFGFIQPLGIPKKQGNPFIQSLIKGEMTFYHSEKHDQTEMAQNGKNPHLLSVLRSIHKSSRYNLNISSDLGGYFTGVIDKFLSKEQELEPWVKNKIRDIIFSVLLTAYDVSSMVRSIKRFKLRDILKAVSHYGDGDNQTVDHLEKFDRYLGWIFSSDVTSLHFPQFEIWPENMSEVPTQNSPVHIIEGTSQYGSGSRPDTLVLLTDKFLSEIVAKVKVIWKRDNDKIKDKLREISITIDDFIVTNKDRMPLLPLNPKLTHSLDCRDYSIITNRILQMSGFKARMHHEASYSYNSIEIDNLYYVIDTHRQKGGHLLEKKEDHVKKNWIHVKKVERDKVKRLTEIYSSHTWFLFDSAVRIVKKSEWKKFIDGVTNDVLAGDVYGAYFLILESYSQTQFNMGLPQKVRKTAMKLILSNGPKWINDEKLSTVSLLLRQGKSNPEREYLEVLVQLLALDKQSKKNFEKLFYLPLKNKIQSGLSTEIITWINFAIKLGYKNEVIRALAESDIFEIFLPGLEPIRKQVRTLRRKMKFEEIELTRILPFRRDQIGYTEDLINSIINDSLPMKTFGQNSPIPIKVRSAHFSGYFDYLQELGPEHEDKVFSGVELLLKLIVKTIWEDEVQIQDTGIWRRKILHDPSLAPVYSKLLSWSKLKHFFNPDLVWLPIANLKNERSLAQSISEDNDFEDLAGDVKKIIDSGVSFPSTSLGIFDLSNAISNIKLAGFQDGANDSRARALFLPELKLFKAVDFFHLYPDKVEVERQVAHLEEIISLLTENHSTASFELITSDLKWMEHIKGPETLKKLTQHYIEFVSGLSAPTHKGHLKFVDYILKVDDTRKRFDISLGELQAWLAGYDATTSLSLRQLLTSRNNKEKSTADIKANQDEFVSNMRLLGDNDTEAKTWPVTLKVLNSEHFGFDGISELSQVNTVISSALPPKSPFVSTRINAFQFSGLLEVLKIFTQLTKAQQFKSKSMTKFKLELRESLEIVLELILSTVYQTVAAELNENFLNELADRFNELDPKLIKALEGSLDSRISKQKSSLEEDLSDYLNNHVGSSSNIKKLLKFVAGLNGDHQKLEQKELRAEKRNKPKIGESAKIQAINSPFAKICEQYLDGGR